MLAYPENVYIVVAIRDKKRSQRWKSNRRGELYGTVADFHFSIAAYLMNEPLCDRVRQREGKVKYETLTPDERKRIFKRVPIFCPSIKRKRVH